MNETFATTPVDRTVGKIARPLLGLACLNAALGLGLPQTLASWTPAFVTSNALAKSQRGLVLLLAAGGFALGAALGLYLWRSGKRANDRRLSVAARLCAPLALIAVLPGLLRMDGWADQLVFALMLGTLVFVAEPMFRLATEAWPLSWQARTAAVFAKMPAPTKRWLPAFVVAAATLTYALYMGFFVLRNHQNFNTYNWDLGHYDTEFWNFLHGNPFRNTLLFREGNWANLRNHVQLTTVVLAPLYALWPRAEGLLLMQAFIVAAGAIPIYRFAKRRVSATCGVVLACAYLLYPPTHGAQFFDFHWQPIAAVFILAAFDAFDANNRKLFWLFFILAIGCREDVSAGTAIVGLWLFVIGYRVRMAAVIFVVSASYFVALRFFVMPAFGAWGFADIYKELFPQGEASFVGIVKTLLTNPLFVFRTLLTPDKLRYSLQILAPLAFLPLRRAYLLPLLIPGAFFTLLTTQYGATLEMNFQYSGLFTAYIFPAAALALASFGCSAEGLLRRRAAMATMILCTIVATTQWGAFPPRKTFKAAYGWIDFEPPTDEEYARLRALEHVRTMIPANAILAASDREIPHVSNRKDCWNLSVGFEGSDYVLYTTVNPIPPDTEQAAAAVRAGYKTVFNSAGIRLLERPKGP